MGEEFIAKLNGTYGTNYWKQLLTGTNNTTISNGINNNKINVKGAVTAEMLVASYNEKYGLTGSNALDYLDSHVQKEDQEEEREYTKEEKEILNRIIKNLSNPKQFRYTEQQVKSILDMLLKSNKINMDMSFDALQNSVYNSLLKNFGSGR